MGARPRSNRCRPATDDRSLDLVELWIDLADDDARCVVLFALDALADGTLAPGPCWSRYAAEVRALAQDLRRGVVSPMDVHEIACRVARSSPP